MSRGPHWRTLLHPQDPDYQEPVEQDDDADPVEPPDADDPPEYEGTSRYHY